MKLSAFITGSNSHVEKGLYEKVSRTAIREHGNG
jgi:hypothetical protein